LPVAALVVSNSDKTCYQPTFGSTNLLQMCITTTLTHAAEMTLRADDSCCTTMFPQSTWRPRLTWQKARPGSEILIKSNLFLCHRSFKFFNCNFLSSVFLFLYCRGSFRRYFSAKMTFSMTSRLH